MNHSKYIWVSVDIKRNRTRSRTKVTPLTPALEKKKDKQRMQELEKENRLLRKENAMLREYFYQMEKRDEKQKNKDRIVHRESDKKAHQHYLLQQKQKSYVSPAKENIGTFMPKRKSKESQQQSQRSSRSRQSSYHHYKTEGDMLFYKANKRSGNNL